MQRKVTLAYLCRLRYTGSMIAAMPETPAEQPAEQLPILLTVAQAARYLSVSIDTVRRWCRSGALRCTLLGDRAGYRIRQSDIVEFLARGDRPKE